MITLLKLIFIPFFVLLLVIALFVVIAILSMKDYNPEDYFDL